MIIRSKAQLRLGRLVAITGKYPIGIQDFEKIRREGYVYVDKTLVKNSCAIGWG